MREAARDGRKFFNRMTRMQMNTHFNKTSPEGKIVDDREFLQRWAKKEGENGRFLMRDGDPAEYP